MISLRKFDNRPVAVASNGKAAVAVIEFDGSIALERHAPSRIGKWENRQEFLELFTRAASKLGYKRDAKARGGWGKF